MPLHNHQVHPLIHSSMPEFPSTLVLAQLPPQILLADFSTPQQDA
ncbi:hypothetical protein EVA_20904 [gut metagenome]|uniref:Uncharacterized protein n=1 Tax=gut metagenome TaxID=749906 RepID=J9F974_9ZZZZ